MKRLIAAIILLVLAVVSALLGNYLLYKVTDTLTQAVMTALITAKNNETDLYTVTQNINEKWEIAQTILHIVTIHDDMTELEMQIESLEDYRKLDNREKYIEACVESLQALKLLRRSGKPDLGNIF